MINKSAGTDWVFGSKFWAIKDGFVVEHQTGNVLDIEGGSLVRNKPVILYPKHGGSNQKWEVVTEDWMKIRNPESGLCLQVTNFGQDLTVIEGGLHIIMFFFQIYKLAAH